MVEWMDLFFFFLFFFNQSVFLIIGGAVYFLLTQAITKPLQHYSSFSLQSAIAHTTGTGACEAFSDLVKKKKKKIPDGERCSFLLYVH